MQRLSFARSSRFGVTSALFFGSGFAALLYQIAWQRMLFGWYGVDLDSISVIVSIFMLGLGIGALLGGWLADRFQRNRIFVFAMIELTIGTFGFFSWESSTTSESCSQSVRFLPSSPLHS